MNRILKAAILIFLVPTFASNAQDNSVPFSPDPNIHFTKQGQGGIFIHSQGWGFFYRKSKIVSIYTKRFWELETATMQDAKEYKTQNQAYPDASSYYFGKLNEMQVFRIGMGYYSLLWRKDNLRCLEVNAVYSGGLSVAVLKPVFLEIIETNSSIYGPEGFTLYTQEYNPQTDNPSNIYGRASIFDGLGELTFRPGAYLRGGLNFDFSSRHNLVKSIETGVEVDAYPKVIPIMAYTPNHQVFANLYLSFILGKRW